MSFNRKNFGDGAGSSKEEESRSYVPFSLPCVQPEKRDAMNMADLKAVIEEEAVKLYSSTNALKLGRAIKKIQKATGAKSLKKVQKQPGTSKITKRKKKIPAMRIYDGKLIKATKKKNKNKECKTEKVIDPEVWEKIHRRFAEFKSKIQYEKRLALIREELMERNRLYEIRFLNRETAKPENMPSTSRVSDSVGPAPIPTQINNTKVNLPTSMTYEKRVNVNRGSATASFIDSDLESSIKELSNLRISTLEK